MTTSGQLQKIRGMKKSKILLVVFLEIMLSGKAICQIVTDRPDQTESSYIVGRGNLQIESGILYATEGDYPMLSRSLLAPTTLFRYGILDGLELRILSQFEFLKTDYSRYQGLSDMEAGAKILLVNNESGNARVALVSHLLIPTGTGELSDRQFGTINKIALSHQINKNMGIGYNLGFSWFDQDNREVTYSVSLGIVINEKAAVYIEPYGEIPFNSDFALNFNTGLTYLVSDNLQLDTSFGTGTNHRMNFISAGISWLIKKE